MPGDGRFFLDTRTARAAWTVLVVAGGLGLVYALRHLVVVVALSLFFAFLLFPLVRLAQRAVPSRLAATALVYLLVVAAIGGAGIAMGPRLGTEVHRVAARADARRARIGSRSLGSRSLG